MSIIWADGFDHYGTGSGGELQMLDGVYAAASQGRRQISTAPARALWAWEAGTIFLRRVFDANKTACGLAGAFYLTNLPSINKACAPLVFNNAANKPVITIELQTTGILAVWRGTGSSSNFDTLLGQSTTLVAPSSWNHIEAKVVIDASASGSVEVRLNGVTVVNLSGISTDNPTDGDGHVAQMVAGFLSNNSGRSMYIDDLVFWDTAGTLNNDFVGDQKVFTDFANADTADVDWTPSSGSARYAMIDEDPADGDATYDTTTNTGDKMGVAFPAVDGSITSIAAVVFYNKSRKTDAGTCNVQVSVVSSAAVDAGADNPMTTEYTYRWDVFETDPNTSAPWVPADAGAAAMLIERTA